MDEDDKMYENNHYVPQLILRRYGTKINRYNIKTKELFINGSTKNAFCEKKLYPEDVEILLGKLESEFTNVLDNKVLKAKDKIVLSRSELNLIKRFLVVLQMRTPSSLGKWAGKKENKELSKSLGFKETVIANETIDEYNLRTIRVLVESKNLKEVFDHPLVTYDACKWITLYNNCYMVIWDSSDTQEDFIITDVGMTCEHEPAKFLVPGYFEELVKEGYLLSHLEEAKNEIEKLMYSEILNRSRFVYANFYMFSISNTRMIGLVNPFFRLYYDKNIVSNLGRVPDVWPTNISKEALEPNDAKYVNHYNIKGVDFVTEYHDKDEYIYKIKNLSLDDVLNINCLMLDRVQEIMGFVNSNNILRSLRVYMGVDEINPRVDYRPLKEELEKMGYTFSKRKYFSDLSKRLDMGYATFTIEDRKYINYMLNLSKELKKYKKNDIN